MRSSTRALLFTAVAPILGALPIVVPVARGADTWDNTSGDGLWSTPANWADNGEPLAGDAVTFPVGFPPNGTAVGVTLADGELAQSLTFNDSYTLGGGSVDLGAGSVVSVANGKTATVNSVLLGAGGLFKSGAGTFSLTSASNLFAGQVDITAGTLNVGSDGALGNAANAIQLDGGALAASGTFATSRSVSIADVPGNAIDVALGHTLTLTSPLSGAGALTVHPTGAGPTGAKTLVLTAASARTAATTIEQGIVRVDHGAALGSGVIDLKLNSALDLNGVTVDQPMALTSAGTVRGRGGNATYAGTITIGPANHLVGLASGNFLDTLTVGNAANDLTGGNSEALIIVSGGGRVRLPFASDYPGRWQVNGGILNVAHANALGTGTTPINMLSNGTSLELSDGVTLDRGVTMPTNTAVIGAGSSSLIGTITIGAGAEVTFGGAANNFTLGDAANDLTGGGAGTAITKSGFGVLTLTQRSNLQAGWLIHGGKVVVQPGAQLGGNGAAGASAVNSLSMTTGIGEQLDLTTNALVVRNGEVGSKVGSTYTGLSGLIQSGRNGGAWNGAGIVTSAPAAATGLTAIGIATGAQLGRNMFGGVSLNAADAVIMYTYMGDANLDGFISGDDYTAIDFNIAVPGASKWVNGDFNYDGIISGDDYSAIDFNIVAQGVPFPTSPGFAGVTADFGELSSSLSLRAEGSRAVPEPISMAVLAVGSAGAFCAGATAVIVRSALKIAVLPQRPPHMLAMQ